MADINKIKLPSGSEYNLKDYRIPGVDTTPTSGSDNIVTSGGIYTALNNAIGSVYRVKGTKATYADLPSSGNVAGDVWNVTAAYGDYPAGTNWVWTGSEWDALGGEIDLSSKQDVLTFDSTPTANSTNPVTSGGVYQSVIDASLVTSAALNDLNTRLDTVEGQGNGKLFFGTCDTAGATAAKVVTCPEFTESDLTVGTAIMVSFDNVNSGAVASLTLNVNNTGAYSIKKLYNTGLANLTSAGEIRASNYLFSYDRNGYWVMMNSDYNSTYTLHSLTHYNGAFTAYNTGYRYQLFVHTDADHIAAFNQNSNTTGTTKTILTDLEFDPFDEIYYYNTTTTIAANASFSSGYLYYIYQSVDLRYTFNVSTSYQALAYPKDVYLKITMLSNGKAKLASADPLTTDLPSTNDGIYYLFLGRSYSAYQIALYCEHPIYYHDGTKVCEFKRDQVQFDTIPTENSTNAVTSGGIYNAIDEVEEVTATALNDLNDRINSVESDLNDIDTPGTLNTTATTAQTTSSSESLSGTINLHKIAKTGSYNDLLNKPPEGPLVVEVNYSQNQYDEMIGTIVSGTVAEIYEAYSNSRPVILRANVILDQDTTDTYYAQLAYSDSVYVENNQLIAGGFCFPVRSKTSSDILFNFVWSVNDEAQNPSMDPGTSLLIPVDTASFYAKYVKTTYSGIDYDYKYVLCDGLTDPNMSANYVLPTPNVTIPSDAKVIATTDQIPNAITESTVSGWGFTKNAAPGTLNTNNTTAQTTSASESLSGTINLHKVAKTGTYSDLIGTPTIPAAQVQSDWNATSGMGVILNKPTFKTFGDESIIGTGDIEQSITISNAQDGLSFSMGNPFCAIITCPSSKFIVGILNFSESGPRLYDISSGVIFAEVKNNKILVCYDWTGTYKILFLYGAHTVGTAEVDGTGTSFPIKTYYSKPGTGIPKTDLTYAVQTSLGKADTALQSFTETDPVFSASPAAGITSSDITNWNSKTSNTGTLTGVSFNGTAATVTNGVAAIVAPQILSGTSDPSSSLGNNGDIYIKLSS